MRVLVSFKPKIKYDNFEGSRLRKCIKGALEVENIQYTSDEVDYFDVAHFISPDDEPKINACLNNNIPVVVSALYCETDPQASYLEYKNRRGNRQLTLKAKAVRVLSKVNLVLVPTEKAKKFLIDNGITTPIEVVSPGINLARFNYLGNDEKEVFYRYYREEANKDLIVILGSCDNTDGINSAIKIAKINKNALVYYFYQNNPSLSWKVKKFLKKKPSNLKFTTIPSDDIYRSAISNAKCFAFTGYDAVGYVSVLEAMAAHTEVVLRKQDLFDDVFIDQKNTHICAYSETLSAVIKDVLEDKIYPTNENAFQFALTQGLDETGEQLKNIYEKLLAKKEN